MKDFIKNTLIFFASISFTIMAAEAAFRVSGSIYQAYRIRNESTGNLDKDTIRILCIGDSFTFGGGAEKGYSYPEQLEKLLNSGEINNKFTVFNAGVCGATSSLLLKGLERNLNRYRPDILILLSGCNENVDMYLQETNYFRFKNNKKSFVYILEDFFSQWRVLKLFKRGYDGLMVQIWKHKLAVKCKSQIGFQTRESGDALSASAGENKTEEFLRYIESGKNYLNNRNSQVTLAAEEYKKAIEIMPERKEGYLLLAETHLHLNQLDPALANLKKAQEIDPYSKDIYAQLWVTYYRMGEVALAREALEKYLCLSPHEIVAYLPLLKYGLPLENDMDTFNKAFLYNIKKIIDTAKSRNIKIILQNYPNNSWQSLKQLAANNNVPFVDHNWVFTKLESREDYKNSDYFAEDGHCNNKGYFVMAENVYAAIKDILMQ